MKQTLFYLFIMFGVVTAFSSCNLNNGNNTTSPPATLLLTANLSPDAPNVDIYINTSLNVTGLPYGNAAGYLQGSPGTYQLRVAPAGTQNFLIDTSYPLGEKQAHSFFIIDSADKMKPAFVKDFTIAPSNDSVRIRFFNFSPNAPALDFAIQGQTPLFNARTFNDQANNTAFSEFILLKAGTYNLELRNAGTSTIAYDTAGVALSGGSVYTYFAKGFVGGAGKQQFSLGKIEH